MSADASVHGDDALLLLHSPDSARLPAEELTAAVRRAVAAVLAGGGPADELWAVGALHPHPVARLAVVVEAAAHPGDEEARALLAWAVNDVDDRVSVAALTAIGEQRDVSALDEVFDAVGRSASAFDAVTSGQVDSRRSAAVSVLADLIRSHPDAPAERHRLIHSSGGQRPNLRHREFDTTGMAEIQAGPGTRFPFFIDTAPVTWREYAEFVEAVRAQGPLWNHPGQQADHDHDVLRHLSADERERLLDHPVTHVTWFDAWAYANWRGKRLPSAAQWEQAAGAPAGLLHPWGDATPTADHAHSAPAGSGGSSPDAFFRGPQDSLTAPVGLRTAGGSPAGVHDLLGNVWEWTRTRFLDGHEISPFVGVASYGETLSDWTLSACVKGGSWTTPAVELSSRARVAKHVLQRGPETGFRCVFEPLGE
ncbi:SUMF1/EgtB/PvdO family nonheme iron enzyme [Streptomyces sp. NBC_01408]|uniref:SUMF1/EgtB/PvdO family nonheme iron enzyme n=1 Tax=Streptomyces sp. NBC_01408 TaxID=2903855 RepID=UPI00224FF3CE|nr:SUMF1/EgtB/PvdO family nonheme iron enzyme [Streptomyces sp. NBC_01408]MCX4692771.1 SUMF1/EgtB/PvdO family nonheme iron enzyme [Streptomyces sp. NBC_01408]